MTHANSTARIEPARTDVMHRSASTLILPQPMSTGARPKHRSGWVRRKRARPGEILAAAADAFSRFGYQRARMVDIATMAGVTKGTIYLYFTSKAELFEHCRPQSFVRIELNLRR